MCTILYIFIVICWGWLIEKQVGEFVVEKYIEISINTGIVYEVKIK